MTATPLEAILKRDRLIVMASLAMLVAIAWFYLFHLAGEMAGMTETGDMGGMPGMEMAAGEPARAGAAVDFLLLAAMWMVMMVGMMAPSAAPTVLLFQALERKREAQNAALGRTALFVAGYFVLWGAFSLVAALAQTSLARAGLISPQMSATSSMLGGAVFIAAGLYEFTPLKHRCLTHCRTPLEWLPRHWRPGRAGALRMGVEHGGYCVGCCWVLMLLLFAGGVMNLIWVAAIAALVLVQKLLPGGPIFARATGVAMVAIGAVLILRPTILT